MCFRRNPGCAQTHHDQHHQCRQRQGVWQEQQGREPPGDAVEAQFAAISVGPMRQVLVRRLVLEVRRQHRQARGVVQMQQYPDQHQPVRRLPVHGRAEDQRQQRVAQRGCANRGVEHCHLLA